MRVKLEVEDDQVEFFLKLIGYFDFVKVEEAAVGHDRIPASIQGGVLEVDQAMLGETKLQSAQEFLDGL